MQIYLYLCNCHNLRFLLDYAAYMCTLESLTSWKPLLLLHMTTATAVEHYDAPTHFYLTSEDLSEFQQPPTRLSWLSGMHKKAPYCNLCCTKTLAPNLGL